MLELGEQAGGGQQGGPGGPPGGLGGPAGDGFGGLPQGNSPEDRLNRKKARLDETDPEQRAYFDQFRYDMAQRLQELGLPATGGFGGGGPRGGGGGRRGGP